MIKVLVIPFAHSPYTVTIDGTHKKFCALVHDVNTDTIFINEFSVVMKVAANKKPGTNQHNVVATMLAEKMVPGFSLYDRIFGDVVIAGLSPEEDYISVPETVMQTVQVMQR